MQPLKELFQKQEGYRRAGGSEQSESRANLIPYIKFISSGRLFAVHIANVREVIDNWKLAPYPELQACHLGIVNIRGQILPVIAPFSRIKEQASFSDEKAHERLLILEIQATKAYCLIVSKVQKVMLASEQIDGHSTVNIGNRPVHLITKSELESILGVLTHEG